MARRRKSGVFGERGADKARLWRKVILITLGSLALLLTVGIIAWYQLLAYLQGDTFRRNMCLHLQQATGAAQVEMADNLRINGDKVAESELRFINMGTVESAGAERILAQIERGKLLDRKLHIRKLTMEEGWITLRTATEPIYADDAESADSETSAPTQRQQGLTDAAENSTDTTVRKSDSGGFAPQSLQLDFAECKDANLSIYRGAKQYSLSGCNITARPMSNGKSWAVELENGRLHTPYSHLRDTNVKTATLLYHPKGIDLTECRLMLTPGELRVRAYYDKISSNWSAELQMHKASVSRLLKDDWKKKLTGELFGKCILRGNENSLRKAEGNLSLQRGKIEGLPFLSELRIDNTQPYRTIELERADCNITYPYSSPQMKLKNAWLIDRIDICSRGNTLIVRGHVIIADDGALGGRLTIGIPRHIADRLPLPSPRLSTAIFNGKGEEGYAWVNINLSGTIDSPSEDLSVRLSTLLSHSLPGMAIDSAGNMLHKLFETAEKARKTVIPEQEDESAPAAIPTQPAETIINGATDLLNKGLQTIF